MQPYMCVGRGPFQDKHLRTVAIHTIDRQAIHNAVFYGQGGMLDQPYPRGGARRCDLGVRGI